MSDRLRNTIARFDAQAKACGDPAGYWQGASLLLAIWSSGALPAASYDPRANVVLMPLYSAFRDLGAALRTAVDARAFPF